MNPIATIVVDSEHQNIAHLSNMLTQHCPEIDVRATTRKICEARQLISFTRPELVFLDMDFPDDLIGTLFEHSQYADFNLILTSAPDKSRKTVGYLAIDHLYKPVRPHELMLALNRHKRMRELQVELNRLKIKQSRTISLSNLNEVQFVHLERIIRLEAASNYTHFFLDNGEKITVSNTLKHYEHMLDRDGFLRVHQSHIINLGKVKKYVKGTGGYAVMEDGYNICISPAKKDSFFKALQLA